MSKDAWMSKVARSRHLTQLTVARRRHGLDELERVDFGNAFTFEDRFEAPA